MKKLISSKKSLAVFLCIAMLLPLFVIGTAAATTFNNLYQKNDTIGIAGNGNVRYWSSQNISVTEGDVIHFGPVFVDQKYFLQTLNGTTNVSQEKGTLVEMINENTAIYTYTVPSGVTQLYMVTSHMFHDCGMITKNQAFTAQDYLDTMKAQGTNVDFLVPTASSGTLNNLYTLKFKGLIEDANTYEDDKVTIKTKQGDEIQNYFYATSDYISISQDDVIYFTVDASQGYHVALYDGNKTWINNTKNGEINAINKAMLIQYEDLGRGYATYAYRAGRTDAKYIRIIAQRGMASDGLELVTKNQPFTGTQYRQFVGLAETATSRIDAKNPSSPLNGKRALFLGDSITEGYRDSGSYGREGLSWAGRINRDTGLDFVNPALHGSTISHLNIGESSGDYTATTDNQGWGWIYNQYNANKGQHFDMVVMHGGVNDARYTRNLGQVSRTNLYDVDSFDLTTYAGGLQYLFANMKSTYPNADLFFIANFRLDLAKIKYGDTTKTLENNGHLGNYLQLAYEICDLYDINLIDLHSNDKLNTELQTNKTTYLEDKLHPSPEGYEIITPYIIKELEAVVEVNEAKDSINNPLASVTVGSNGASVAKPSTPSSPGYSVWDGTTYDQDWESAGDNAYYIQSAAELAGLKKSVDDLAQKNADEWLAAANAAIEASGTVPNSKDYIHEYNGTTFYITVNIDLNNVAWDGIGTTDHWAVFAGTLAGAANKVKGEMVYIKGLNAVYNKDERIGTVTATSNTAITSVTNGNIGTAVDGVGLVTIQSAGGIKDLTLVEPKATVEIAHTGFFVGRTRSNGSSYSNLHVINGSISLKTKANRIGGILGTAEMTATIDGCTVSGTFNLVNGTAAPANIGGIVGMSQKAGTKITNCSADVDFIHYGGKDMNIGGIIGTTSAALTVQQCSYVGTLDITSAASGSIMAGGVLGIAKTAGGSATTPGLLIQNCKADFTCVEPDIVVTKIAGIMEGGAAGTSGDQYAVIQNCAANVNFEVKSAGDEQNLAGIVGYSSGKGHLTIDKCLSTGTIKVVGDGALNSFALAGILGASAGDYSDTVTNCKSTVTLDFAVVNTSGRATFYRSGGIMGIDNATGVTTITGCVFSGNIKASGTGGQLQEIGGIVGVSAGTKITDCVVGKINANGSVSPIEISCKDAANTYNGGKIGGVIGWLKNNTANAVTNCQASVNFIYGGTGIKDDGTDATTAGMCENTGGIIGLNDSVLAEDMSNCAFYGSIATTDGIVNKGALLLHRVGGLIGLNTQNIAIKNATVDFIVRDTTTQTTTNFESNYIAGLIGYTSGATTIDGCHVTFSHYISTPYTAATYFGGVIGLAENTVTVKNGTVDYEMHADKANVSANRIGGIVGMINASILEIDNCYVTGVMNNVHYAGGIVGSDSTKTTSNTIKNTQSEMIINGAGTQCGAFIGRLDSVLTMDNCLLTGVNSQNRDVNYAFGWIGLLSSVRDSANDAITITNCYSNSKLPMFPSMDGKNDGNTAFTGQILLNGSLYPTTANTFDRGNLINAIEIKDAETLSGSVWTTYTDGTNPILTVAKDIERPYAKADLRWFDPTTTIPASYKLTTEGQVVGLAMLSQVEGFYNDVHQTAATITMDRDCILKDQVTGEDHSLLISKHVKYTVAGICAHHRTDPLHPDGCTGKVVSYESLNVQKQTSAATSGDSSKINIRFIAKIENDLIGYNTVGFVFKSQNGETFTYSTTKVYKGIQTASGVVTDNNHYYFAFDFYNVPKDAIFKVTAFAEYQGHAAYGSGETVNVNQLV